MIIEIDGPRVVFAYTCKFKILAIETLSMITQT